MPPSRRRYRSARRGWLLPVATDDDRVVEGDGSVTATVTAGEGYALGETLSATVAVEDGDAATFAADRTRALAVSGQVAESDYELDASTLVLAAGGSSVQSTFAALADDVDEEVETAEVAALDPDGTGAKPWDVAALAALARLRALDLGGNAVTDVAPLAGLAAVEALDLRGNRVEEATPPARLRAKVELGGNAVEHEVPQAAARPAAGGGG